MKERHLSDDQDSPQKRAWFGLGGGEIIDRKRADDNRSQTETSLFSLSPIFLFIYFFLESRLQDPTRSPRPEKGREREIPALTWRRGADLHPMIEKERKEGKEEEERRKNTKANGPIVGPDTYF